VTLRTSFPCLLNALQGFLSVEAANRLELMRSLDAKPMAGLLGWSKLPTSFAAHIPPGLKTSGSSTLCLGALVAEFHRGAAAGHGASWCCSFNRSTTPGGGLCGSDRAGRWSGTSLIAGRYGRSSDASYSGRGDRPASTPYEVHWAR